MIFSICGLHLVKTGKEKEPLGIVLVSSPQDLAGMVVRKAANMARQMQTPILGLVENMSYFECPDTGKRYELFGPSHAEETAQRIGVPFLGGHPSIRKSPGCATQGASRTMPASSLRPSPRILPVGRLKRGHRA
jgi:hypothetical protein